MALCLGCRGSSPDGSATSGGGPPARPGSPTGVAESAAPVDTPSTTAPVRGGVPEAVASAGSSEGGPSARASWQGTYRSVASTVYVPADWKSVHWSVPDSPSGLGDGSLSLTTDRATGRVEGVIEGPLGPATVEGLVHGDTMAATIARRDPADRGFVGTLFANLADATWKGAMHVSLGEASAVRTAEFSLAQRP